MLKGILLSIAKSVSRKEGKITKQTLMVGGLLLMAVSLPFASKLVSQVQDNRNRAMMCEDSMTGCRPVDTSGTKTVSTSTTTNSSGSPDDRDSTKKTPTKASTSKSGGTSSGSGSSSCTKECCKDADCAGPCAYCGNGKCISGCTAGKPTFGNTKKSGLSGSSAAPTSKPLSSEAKQTISSLKSTTDTKSCAGGKAGDVSIGAGDVIYGCNGKTGTWVNLSQKGVGPEAVTNKPSWFTPDSKTWQNAATNASTEPIRAAEAAKGGSGSSASSSRPCAGGYSQGAVAIGNVVNGQDQLVECKNGLWTPCKLCKLTVVPEYVNQSKDLKLKYITIPDAVQKASQSGDLSGLIAVCRDKGESISTCANLGALELMRTVLGADYQGVYSAYQLTKQAESIANKAANGDKKALEDLCIAKEKANVPGNVSVQAAIASSIEKDCRARSVKDLAKKYLTGYDADQIDKSYTQVRDSKFAKELGNYLAKAQEVTTACMAKSGSQALIPDDVAGVNKADWKVYVTKDCVNTPELKKLADTLSKEYAELLADPKSHLSADYIKKLQELGLDPNFKNMDGVNKIIASAVTGELSKSGYESLKYDYLRNGCEGDVNEKQKGVCANMKKDLGVYDNQASWKSDEKNKVEAAVKNKINVEDKMAAAGTYEDLTKVCRDVMGVSSKDGGSCDGKAADINLQILRKLYPGADVGSLQAMATTYTNRQQEAANKLIANKGDRNQPTPVPTNKVFDPRSCYGFEGVNYCSSGLNETLPAAVYSYNGYGMGAKPTLTQAQKKQQEEETKKAQEKTATLNAAKSFQEQVDAKARMEFVEANKNTISQSFYQKTFIQSQYDTEAYKYLADKRYVQGGVAGTVNNLGLRATNWAANYNEAEVWNAKYTLQSKEKDLQTALQNVTDEHQKSWDEYNLKKVQKADSSLNEIRGMNLTATGINAATTVGAGVAVATGAGAALAPVVLAGSAALTTSMRERADAVYHENAQLFEDTTGGVQYNYNSQFTVKALEMLDEGNVAGGWAILIAQPAADGLLNYAGGKMIASVGGAGGIYGIAKNALSAGGASEVASSLVSAGRTAFQQEAVSTALGRSAAVGTVSQLSVAANEGTTKDVVVAAMNTGAFALTSIVPGGKVAQIAAKTLMPAAFAANSYQAVSTEMASGKTLGQAILSKEALTQEALTLMSMAKWKTINANNPMLAKVDVGVNAAMVTTACSQGLNNNECKMALMFMGQSLAHASRPQSLFDAQVRIEAKQKEMKATTDPTRKAQLQSEIAVEQNNLGAAEKAWRSGAKESEVTAMVGSKTPVAATAAERTAITTSDDLREPAKVAERLKNESEVRREQLSQIERDLGKEGLSANDKRSLTERRNSVVDRLNEIDTELGNIGMGAEAAKPAETVRLAEPKTGEQPKAVAETQKTAQDAAKARTEAEARRTETEKVWNDRVKAAEDRVAAAQSTVEQRTAEAQLAQEAKTAAENGKKAADERVKSTEEEAKTNPTEENQMAVAEAKAAQVEAEKAMIEANNKVVAANRSLATAKGNLTKANNAKTTAQNQRTAAVGEAEKQVQATTQRQNEAETAQKKATAQAETDAAIAADKDVQRQQAEVDKQAKALAEKQKQLETLQDEERKAAEEEVKALEQRKKEAQDKLEQDQKLVAENQRKIQESKQPQKPVQEAKPAEAQAATAKKGLAGLFDRIVNSEARQKRSKLAELDRQIAEAEKNGEYVKYRETMKEAAKAATEAEASALRDKARAMETNEGVKKAIDLINERRSVADGGSAAGSTIGSAYIENMIKDIRAKLETGKKLAEAKRAESKAKGESDVARNRVGQLKDQLRALAAGELTGDLKNLNDWLARRAEIREQTGKKTGFGGELGAEDSSLEGRINQLCEKYGIDKNAPDRAARLREVLEGQIAEVNSAIEKDPVAAAKELVGEKVNLVGELETAIKEASAKKTAYEIKQGETALAKENDNRAAERLQGSRQGLAENQGVVVKSVVGAKESQPKAAAQTKRQPIFKARTGEPRKGWGAIVDTLNPAERTRRGEIAATDKQLPEAEKAVSEAKVEFDKVQKELEEVRRNGGDETGVSQRLETARQGLAQAVTVLDALGARKLVLIGEAGSSENARRIMVLDREIPAKEAVLEGLRSERLQAENELNWLKSERDAKINDGSETTQAEAARYAEAEKKFTEANVKYSEAESAWMDLVGERRELTEWSKDLVAQAYGENYQRDIQAIKDAKSELVEAGRDKLAVERAADTAKKLWEKTRSSAKRAADKAAKLKSQYDELTARIEKDSKEAGLKEELGKLEADRTSAMDEIEGLKADLEQFSAMGEKERVKGVGKKQLVAETKRQIEARKAELEYLNAQINETRNKLNNTVANSTDRARANDLAERLRVAEKEATRLRNEASDQEGAYREYEADLVEAKRLLAEKSENLSKLTRPGADGLTVSEKSKAALDLNRDTNIGLADLRAERIRLEQQLEGLKNGKSAEEIAASEDIALVSGQLDRVNANIQELTRAENKALADMGRTSQRRNVWQVVNDLVRPNANLEARLETAKAEVRDLEAIIAQGGLNEAELATAQARLTEARGRAEAIGTRLGEIKAQNEAKNERARLQAQIDEARGSVEKIELELAKIEGELSAKRIEATERNKREASLIRDIEKLTEKKDKALARLKTAEEKAAKAVAEAEKKGVVRRRQQPQARTGEPRKGAARLWDRLTNPAERARVAEISRLEEEVRLNQEAYDKAKAEAKKATDEYQKALDETERRIAQLSKNEQKRVRKLLSELKEVEADKSYKASETEIEEYRKDPKLAEASTVEEMMMRILEKWNKTPGKGTDNLTNPQARAKARAVAEQMMTDPAKAAAKATEKLNATEQTLNGSRTKLNQTRNGSGAAAEPRQNLWQRFVEGRRQAAAQREVGNVAAGMEKVNGDLKEMAELRSKPEAERSQEENARLTQLSERYERQVLSQEQRTLVEAGKIEDIRGESNKIWGEIEKLGGRRGQALREAYERLQKARETNRKTPNSVSTQELNQLIKEYHEALDALRSEVLGRRLGNGRGQLEEIQAKLQQIDVLNEVATLQEKIIAGGNEKEVAAYKESLANLLEQKEMLLPELPGVSDSIRREILDVIKDTEHRLATNLDGARVSRNSQVDTFQKLMSGNGVAVELTTNGGKTMVGAIYLRTRVEVMGKKTGVYLAKEGATEVIRDQIQAMVGRSKRVAILDVKRLGDANYVAEVLAADYVIVDATNVDFLRNNYLDLSNPHNEVSTKIYQKLTRDVAVYADEAGLTLDPRKAGINTRGNDPSMTASKKQAAVDVGEILVDMGVLRSGDGQAHNKWGADGAVVRRKTVTTQDGKVVEVETSRFSKAAESEIYSKLRTRNDVGGDFFDAVRRNATEIEAALKSGDPALIEAAVKKAYNDRIPEGVDLTTQVERVLDQIGMVNTFGASMDVEFNRTVDTEIQAKNTAEFGNGGRYDKKVSVPRHNGVDNKGQSFTGDQQMVMEVIGAVRREGGMNAVDFEGLRATDQKAYRSTVMEWMADVRSDSANSVAAVTGTLGGNRGVVETVLGLRVHANNEAVVKVLGDITDPNNKGRLANSDNSYAVRDNNDAELIYVDLKTNGHFDSSKGVDSNGNIKIVVQARGIEAIDVARADFKASDPNKGEVTYFVQEGGEKFYEIKFNADGSEKSRTPIKIDDISARFASGEKNLRVVIDRGGATGTSIVTDVNVPGVLITEYAESAYNVAQAGSRFNRGPGDPSLTVIVVGATKETAAGSVVAKSRMNFGEWRISLHESEIRENKTNNTDGYDSVVQAASARPVVDLIAESSNARVRKWASERLVEEFGPERRGRDLSSVDGAQTTIERRNGIAQKEAAKWKAIFDELNSTEEGKVILADIERENPEIYKRMVANRDFEGKFEYLSEGAEYQARDPLLAADSLDNAAKFHRETVKPSYEHEYVVRKGIEQVVINPVAAESAAPSESRTVAPEVLEARIEAVDAIESVKPGSVEQARVVEINANPSFANATSANHLAVLMLQEAGVTDINDPQRPIDMSAVAETKYYAEEAWKAREAAKAEAAEKLGDEDSMAKDGEALPAVEEAKAPVTQAQAPTQESVGQKAVNALSDLANRARGLLTRGRSAQPATTGNKGGQTGKASSNDGSDTSKTGSGDNKPAASTARAEKIAEIQKLTTDLTGKAADDKELAGMTDEQLDKRIADLTQTQDKQTAASEINQVYKDMGLNWTYTIGNKDAAQVASDLTAAKEVQRVYNERGKAAGVLPAKSENAAEYEAKINRVSKPETAAKPAVQTPQSQTAKQAVENNKVRLTNISEIQKIYSQLGKGIYDDSGKSDAAVVTDLSRAQRELTKKQEADKRAKEAQQNPAVVEQKPDTTTQKPATNNVTTETTAADTEAKRLAAIAQLQKDYVSQVAILLPKDGESADAYKTRLEELKQKQAVFDEIGKLGGENPINVNDLENVNLGYLEAVRDSAQARNQIIMIELGQEGVSEDEMAGKTYEQLLAMQKAAAEKQNPGNNVVDAVAGAVADAADAASEVVNNATEEVAAAVTAAQTSTKPMAAMNTLVNGIRRVRGMDAAELAKAKAGEILGSATDLGVDEAEYQRYLGLVNKAIKFRGEKLAKEDAKNAARNGQIAGAMTSAKEQDNKRLVTDASIDKNINNNTLNSLANDASLSGITSEDELTAAILAKWNKPVTNDNDRVYARAYARRILFRPFVQRGDFDGLIAFAKTNGINDPILIGKLTQFSAENQSAIIVNQALGQKNGNVSFSTSDPPARLYRVKNEARALAGQKRGWAREGLGVGYVLPIVGEVYEMDQNGQPRKLSVKEVEERYGLEAVGPDGKTSLDQAVRDQLKANGMTEGGADYQAKYNEAYEALQLQLHVKVGGGRMTYIPQTTTLVIGVDGKIKGMHFGKLDGVNLTEYRPENGDSIRYGANLETKGAGTPEFERAYFTKQGWVDDAEFNKRFEEIAAKLGWNEARRAEKRKEMSEDWSIGHDYELEPGSNIFYSRAGNGYSVYRKYPAKKFAPGMYLGLIVNPGVDEFLGTNDWGGEDRARKTQSELMSNGLDPSVLSAIVIPLDSQRQDWGGTGGGYTLSIALRIDFGVVGDDNRTFEVDKIDHAQMGGRLGEKYIRMDLPKFFRTVGNNLRALTLTGFRTLGVDMGVGKDIDVTGKLADFGEFDRIDTGKGRDYTEKERRLLFRRQLSFLEKIFFNARNEGFNQGEYTNRAPEFKALLQGLFQDADIVKKVMKELDGMRRRFDKLVDDMEARNWAEAKKTYESMRADYPDIDKYLADLGIDVEGRRNDMESILLFDRAFEFTLEVIYRNFSDYQTIGYNKQLDQARRAAINQGAKADEVYAEKDIDRVREMGRGAMAVSQAAPVGTQVDKPNACSDCNAVIGMVNPVFNEIDYLIAQGDSDSLQRADKLLQDLMNSPEVSGHKFGDQAIQKAIDALIALRRMAIRGTQAERQNAVSELDAAIAENNQKLDDLSGSARSDQLDFINYLNGQRNRVMHQEVKGSPMMEYTGVLLDDVVRDAKRTLGLNMGEAPKMALTEVSHESMSQALLDKAKAQKAAGTKMEATKDANGKITQVPVTLYRVREDVPAKADGTRGWSREGNGVGAIVPMMQPYRQVNGVMVPMTTEEVEKYYGYEAVRDENGAPVQMLMKAGGGRMIYVDQPVTAVVRNGKVTKTYMGVHGAKDIPSLTEGDEIVVINNVEYKGVGTPWFAGHYYQPGDTVYSLDAFDKIVAEATKGMSQEEKEKTINLINEEIYEGRAALVGGKYYTREGDGYRVVDARSARLANGQGIEYGVFVDAGQYQPKVRGEAPGSSSYGGEHSAKLNQEEMMRNGAQLNVVVLEVVPADSWRSDWGGKGGSYKYAISVRGTIGGRERMGFVDSLQDANNDLVAPIKDALGSDYAKEDPKTKVSPMKVMLQNLARNARAMLKSKLTFLGSMSRIGKDLDSLGRLADLGEVRHFASDADPSYVDSSNRVMIRKWLEFGGRIYSAFSSKNGDRIYNASGRPTLELFLNELFGGNVHYTDKVIGEFEAAKELTNNVYQMIKSGRSQTEVDDYINSIGDKRMQSYVRYMLTNLDNALGQETGNGKWYSVNNYALLANVINENWKDYQIAGIDVAKEAERQAKVADEAADNYGLTGEVPVKTPVKLNQFAQTTAPIASVSQDVDSVSRRPVEQDIEDELNLTMIEEDVDVPETPILVEQDVDGVLIPVEVDIEEQQRQIVVDVEEDVLPPIELIPEEDVEPIPVPIEIIEEINVDWMRRFWILWDGFLGDPLAPPIVPILPPVPPMIPWLPFPWPPYGMTPTPIMPPPRFPTNAPLTTPTGGQPLPSGNPGNPTPSGTSGGNPGEGACACPKDFKCYFDSSISEYRWFVQGYVMDDFKKVEDKKCNDAGVSKPTYKGKAKGDANCDGFINIWDNSVWRNEYADIDKKKGTQKQWWKADYNCDKLVNEKDYNIWKSNYKTLNTEDESY